MDEIPFQIACGKCETPLEGPADPQPEDVLTCPTCGRSDRLEVVLAEVREFLKELTAKALQRAIGQGVRDAKHITVRDHPIPEREYRFIGIRKTQGDTPA